jgi:hypothetical protein
MLKNKKIKEKPHLYSSNINEGIDIAYFVKMPN